MARPSLSVVIPAYNEARRLPQSLGTISRYLREAGWSAEIIVVNDGSADDTVKVANQFGEDIKLINLPVNQGKGAAVQTGIMAAQNDLVLFTDADLSTPISELPKLVEAVEAGADIAIGSRAQTGSAIEKYQPLYRQLLGKFGNSLIRLFLGVPFYDTQCGFKLFRRQVGQQLFKVLLFKGWSFDFEIVYRAQYGGYLIKEVPVRWAHQTDSKFALVDSLACLVALVYLRLRLPPRLISSRHDQPFR
jgi:dolichyl-phosphate beta-glucosyltransferase